MFLLLLLISSLLAFIIIRIKRKVRVETLINKIPGPPSLPLVGNALDMNVSNDEVFSRICVSSTIWGKNIGMYRAWFGSRPYIFLFAANTVECILNSNKHISKSHDYTFLHPWLGTGLLTSSGQKWHSRRKILTPTFHFRILEDFLDVFKEQSDILVKCLEKELNNNGFNIFPYITLCTLDIICETAMGRKVYAQENSNSEYVKAVYELGNIIQMRQSKLFYQSDFLFKMSKYCKRHEECVKTLHGVSNKVIQERKKVLKEKNVNNCIDDDTGIGQKKRLAFLDLLIEASQDGSILSDQDIREEVDTFMFEGHDTTSASISWCLFLLGSHPEIQEKVYEEIENVVGGEDETITMKSLQDLRYLECCIKEALRLYPSVPNMGRELQQDLQMGEYLIPAGTTVIIMTYMLHRDSNVFPYPEIFNPDRFLPENIQGRHPYSYIPFSAGPRNCIGQKFALLEEKVVISTLIRKYHFKSVDRRENINLLGELVLRPKNGLTLLITKR